MSQAPGELPEEGKGPVVSPRRPGLADVARIAGVSHQTVSRVLNGHPSVRPETRARVLAAMEQVGYRRNAAARALVTRRTQTIGVLSAGNPWFGPTSTLLAVADAARASGYFLSLAVVRESSEQEVAEAFEHFMAQGVEGVVVILPVESAVAAARAASLSVPVVIAAAGPLTLPGFRSTSVDHRLGAVMATRHLLELGHRDVLHVTGPLDWVEAVERVEGWQAERARWGLTPGEPIEGDWTSARGYAVGQDLVAQVGRGERALPTAIFAANDHLALGLLRAFAEEGIAVPGQLSVVGFDDIDGADYFSPPLTTVRQPFTAMGRQCVDMLLGELRSEGGRREPDGARPIPPTLVVRGSTAPPQVQEQVTRRGRRSSRAPGPASG